MKGILLIMCSLAVLTTFIVSVYDEEGSLLNNFFDFENNVSPDRHFGNKQVSEDIPEEIVVETQDIE